MAHPLPPSALHGILTMFDSSPNRRSRPIGRLRKGLVAENGDREAAAAEGRCSVNNGHSPSIASLTQKVIIMIDGEIHETTVFLHTGYTSSFLISIWDRESYLVYLLIRDPLF